MTDVEKQDAVRTLFAMRVQIDALIARLQPEAAPQSPEREVVTTTAPAGACSHPQAKRETISGFGGGPRQFFCHECGRTITE